MRKVVVALLSAIVAGLMLVPSVSAGAKTATFTDRQGDLGKTLVCPGQGSHEWGDMLSYWSGNSPIANAGYLDMLSGWVSVKGDTVKMGVTLASPVPVNGNLPEGVKEVRWVWLLWTTIETTASGNDAAYGVYILWNGNGLSAVMVDRTSGSAPFALTYPDFVVNGNALTVTMSLASIPGVVAWYCQTQAWNAYPPPLDQPYPWASWVLTDMTDYQGPLAIYWPWQAMP